MHCKTRKNWKRRVLSFRISKEDLPSVLRAIIIVCLLGKLFYDSWIGIIALSPLGFLYIRREQIRIRKDKKRKLGIQFKDAILSIAATQRAGYSAENAIGEAVHDMEMLHGKDADIVNELMRITQGLRNNLTLEEMLDAFARRADHADITEFAEIFRVAKRNGGNMTGIIADTADVIADKIETERQIHVIIAAKRLEAQIMEVVPLFIILYVGATNQGFFAPLYHSLFGVLFMSAALAVYLCAYLMTEKIIAIEV